MFFYLIYNKQTASVAIGGAEIEREVGAGCKLYNCNHLNNTTIFICAFHRNLSPNLYLSIHFTCATFGQMFLTMVLWIVILCFVVC